MDKAVILTQVMMIDGHAVRMTFAQEDNAEAMQEVRDILLSSIEYSQNLCNDSQSSAGGVANAEII